MYIKMNDDKSLVVTVPTTIYRGENKADMVTFLVPANYGDLNVADCDLTVRYILPDEEATGRSEPLLVQPEMYKGYLQYNLSVDTQLTSHEGDVIVWLVALNATGSMVLKTGETVIVIAPARDITDYMSGEDLDQLDQLALQVKALAQSKADNIVFDTDKRMLHLTANGKEIGDAAIIPVCDGGGGGVVYVPSIDNKKILSWTIEEATGEVPAPVDLNPFDEWGNIDSNEAVSDYVWEEMQ